ncbi:hypothetical protein ABIB58_000317 [Brevundimonas sp. UYEF29]
MDRAVQGPGVAAREVAARRAVVGHEHGVAGEYGVGDAAIADGEGDAPLYYRERRP